MGQEPLELILAELRLEHTSRHLAVTKNHVAQTNNTFTKNAFLFIQKRRWCLPGTLIEYQYHEEMGLVRKLDENDTNQLHQVHAVQGHLMLLPGTLGPFHIVSLYQHYCKVPLALSTKYDNDGIKREKMDQAVA